MHTTDYNHVAVSQHVEKDTLTARNWHRLSSHIHTADYIYVAVSRHMEKQTVTIHNWHRV